jgi:hypothetical protein
MTSGVATLLKGVTLSQSQTERTGLRGRVLWKSCMAALLWTVQVAALLIALFYWFVINANRDEANRRRLSDLQLDVSVHIAELRQTVATGLGEMRLQLDALPEMRARLDPTERQVANLEARHAQLDTRITTLERQLGDLRSDMSAITRASNVPLPGTRR